MPEATRRTRPSVRVLLPAAVLVLVALCLRGPFAAVGPVLTGLHQETGLPTAALAGLTSLPLLCFALVSPLAPALARRAGTARAVLAGVLLLAVGVALRSAGGTGLFAGTVLLGAGIAVANVLLPALARTEYGARAPAVIGATTGAVALSASIGAGLAQPAAAVAGSARGGLALWLPPVLLAAAALAVLVRARGRVPVPARPPRPGALLRDPVARAVTGFFGVQSLIFYALLTWLPEVLQDEAGLSPRTAGTLLAVAAALGAPASVVVPTLAARRLGQGAWVVGVAVPTAVALLGLLLAPSAAPALWAVLFGLGTGAAFPLAMTLVLLRTRDAAQTSRLSAGAQSVGYLLAATGPLAVGLLHDAAGSWHGGLLLLLVLVGLQTAVGLAAARPRRVGEGSTR